MDKLNKGGWTLIELVIVIVLMGILSLVIVPKISIDDFKKESELNILMGNIRYAQHKSMVSGGGWSIEFQPGGYTIKDGTNKVVSLPGGENPVSVTFNLTATDPKCYFDYLGRPDRDDNSSNSNLYDNFTINFADMQIILNKAGGIDR
ncbi:MULTISPECIES: pilus assembly FimT family protein [Calditerrivibrio]